MAADFYANGAKETWRGWWTNRLCERIPKCYRREAVGLYLPGPKDRDRKTLISKGFSNDNLIAVDRDLDCVKSVRNGGGIAIQGELHETLVAIRSKVRIGFVSADMLGGLSEESYRLIRSIQRSGDGATVGVINMQRGRDSWGGLAASTLIDSGGCFSSRFKWSCERTRRHRGMLLFKQFVYGEIEMWEWALKKKMTIDQRVRFQNQLFQHMQPELNSYPSERGNLWFDSIVFTSYMENGCDIVAGPSKIARLRVAAALAVRTVKQGARSPGLVPSRRPGMS